MTAPVDRLRRLADALRGGCDVPADDALRLASAIQAYLAGNAPTLDDALGLRPRPGERDWRTAEALAERDRLLRAAAERFFPGQRDAEQARQLAEALAQYRARAWPRERHAEQCPARHIGKVYEACWHVLRLRDADLSTDRIRKILGASCRYS